MYGPTSCLYHLGIGALRHYRPQAVKTLQAIVPDMPCGAVIYTLKELGSFHLLLLAYIQCKELCRMAQ